jgi:hypothetical protein
MPITADGCQTTTRGCPARSAAAKYADQSRPGAFVEKSESFHGLFALCTSTESVRETCVSAIRFSSA